MKLICIPHAGSFAGTYYQLKKYLDDPIELEPFELAGRGSRLNEKKYENFEEAVEDIYRGIMKRVKGPYAILGHSMGSWFAYEVYKKIVQNHSQPPVHIFFSGNYPPYIGREKAKLFQLSDDEFMDEILKFGGTSMEVIKNKILYNIFLPILRADYQILESYQCDPEFVNIECGVTVFNGLYDKIPQSDLECWRRCANHKFRIIQYEGGHFFLFEKPEMVGRSINEELSGYL